MVSPNWKRIVGNGIIPSIAAMSIWCLVLSPRGMSTVDGLAVRGGVPPLCTLFNCYLQTPITCPTGCALSSMANPFPGTVPLYSGEPYLYLVGGDGQQPCKVAGNSGCNMQEQNCLDCTATNPPSH